MNGAYWSQCLSHYTFELDSDFPHCDITQTIIVCKVMLVSIFLFQDFLWENHFLDKNLLLYFQLLSKNSIRKKKEQKRFFMGFSYFSKMKHEMELNMADAEQVTCVRIEPENPSLLCLVFAFTTIDYWVTNQYNGGSFLIP